MAADAFRALAVAGASVRVGDRGLGHFAARWLARGSCGALCLVLLFGPAALAQQTIVIGDDPPGGTAEAEAPAVIVNQEVLDNLGTGLSAPEIAPEPGGAAPAAAGTVYRKPETGEAVATPPTALAPAPAQPPKSRLTVAPPAADETAPKAESEGGVAGLAAPAPPPAEPPQPVEAAPAAPAPAPAAATAIEGPPPPPALLKELKSAPPPAGAAPQAEPLPAPAPERLAAPSAPAAPEPPAAPAAPAAPGVEKESQRAALGAVEAAGIRLLFKDGSAEISGETARNLAAFARSMEDDEAARMHLLAYAKSDEQGSSRARRLSLSRALAVRAFLVNRGIDAQRMDVRALGNTAKEGPPDRVDILLKNSAQ